MSTEANREGPNGEHTGATRFNSQVEEKITTISAAMSHTFRGLGGAPDLNLHSLREHGLFLCGGVKYHDDERQLCDLFPTTVKFIRHI